MFNKPLIRSQLDEGYVRADDSATRALQTRELAAYLWDNYIEYVPELAEDISTKTCLGRTQQHKCSSWALGTLILA